MSEVVEIPRDANGEFDPGKRVGDFEYADGSGTRPVHANAPEWVQIGDVEGWMSPRTDGSFELNPIDAKDPRFTTDQDFGPRSVDGLPAELPMRVLDAEMGGDQPREHWNDVVYKPLRDN